MAGQIYPDNNKDALAWLDQIAGGLPEAGARPPRNVVGVPGSYRILSWGALQAEAGGEEKLPSRGKEGGAQSALK